MSDADSERKTPPIFTQNEHWLDRAIADARKEGAFDNLPNTGKPLKLDESSVDSEYDLAFTMLKNAGVSPYWMEMQKDTDALLLRLQIVIDRVNRFLEEAAIALQSDQPALDAPPPVSKSIWSRIFGRSVSPEAVSSVRFERADLLAARAKARTEYLEIAAELDAHLVSYHQSLPSNLWHLQRYRKSPDEFAADFDTAVPEIGDRLAAK